MTATAALARALSIPVIASGGVGSIADIEALVAAKEPNIEGVVVGRALYDGRIDRGRGAGRAAKLTIRSTVERLSGLAQTPDDLVQLFQGRVADIRDLSPPLSPLWMI